MEQINDNDGIWKDAAVFIARLRSCVTVSLATEQEIISMCSDLFKSVVGSLHAETSAILGEHCIESSKTMNLLQAMKLLENPFTGLETAYRQTKYFEQKGVYIAPKSVQ